LRIGGLLLAVLVGACSDGVDCDRLVKHTIDVAVKDAAAGSADAKAQVEAAMKEQQAAAVKACREHAKKKSITPKKYQCAMAAKTMAEISKCGAD